jgi:hypothetical protein
MPAKNEPECWTCKMIEGKAPNVVCSKHAIAIPDHKGGAYYICRDFQHYLYPDVGLEIVGAKKQDMRTDTLYTFEFMDTVPPCEYALFAKLKVQASKVKS